MAAGAIRELSAASGRPALAQVWLNPGSEWVLAGGGRRYTSQASRIQARRLARDLVAAHAPTGGEGPSGFAIVRVPAIDPFLGAGVLHYSTAAGTVIYCPEEQLTDIAQGPLEDLLAAVLRRSRSLPRGGPPGALTVRLQLEDHDHMPQLLHPVSPARIRPQAVTAWVCEEHLTAELAQWLGALCTAQAAALRDGSWEPESR